MKINKIKSYLGFAIRSGEIVFGSDNLFVSKKKCSLVLICSSQNEKVTNKVIRYCDEKQIEFVKLTDLLLSDLCGRSNCKVIGVTDNNLANAIKNEFQMEN